MIKLLIVILSSLAAFSKPVLDDADRLRLLHPEGKFREFVYWDKYNSVNSRLPEVTFSEISFVDFEEYLLFVRNLESQELSIICEKLYEKKCYFAFFDLSVSYVGKGPTAFNEFMNKVVSCYVSLYSSDISPAEAVIHNHMHEVWIYEDKDLLKKADFNKIYNEVIKRAQTIKLPKPDYDRDTIPIEPNAKQVEELKRILGITSPKP